MANTNSVHIVVTNFKQDFKAESIAAEIAESGTDPEQILIILSGALKRTFSNDVSEVETELSDDYTEYVVVKAAREGLYDMLPQGLFHHPGVNKSNLSDKEITATMKQRRLEELNARKFFIPFEATINHLRIQMAMHENRLDKRSHYDDLVQIFAPHWEIFKYLDARQSDIFLHLIPVIHDIRDDHEKLEEILEMMFETTIKVIVRNQAETQCATSFVSVLGMDILGVDLTTGNTQFAEAEDEIVISAGPLDSKRFRQFMTGGINEKILSTLCGYLLPVEAEVITEILLERDDQQALLAGEYDEHNCRLGEDMVLG